MAKKKKKKFKAPITIPITPEERIQYMIDLIEAAVTDSDSEINDILEEQIVRLQIRLQNLKSEAPQSSLNDAGPV